MRISLFIILLFILNSNISKAQNSHDFEISKNLDIYTSLIQQLDLHYVDEIQPGALSKAAIDAMLKQIDPYTVYYAEADIEDVRFMQTGKYGGVGSSMHIVDKQVIVGRIYKGFPFDKAGISPGDFILEVDGESVYGKKMSEISQKLKGSAGTKLSVKFHSIKKGKDINVDIKREEIKIKDVPYFGLLNDSTAYINLASFRKTATKEVAAALDSMNRDSKLKALVFDLRNNGGGLLIEAVKILDLFVPQNETIVTTKGKTAKENHNYKTQISALYPNLKIVVLMNKNSASASEIVAGSFQDLDRAVIMGQKSYGKGLVQKVFSLSYRSQAKITVAKYYIPSGRCIQELDYQHKDSRGRAIKTPDSLMATFKTKNGRLVKDAGGIIPDVKLESNHNSELLYALNRKYMIFDFVTQYVSTHDSITSVNNIVVTDDIYNSFLAFIKTDSFSYDSKIEKQLISFEESIKSDDYDIDDELKALRSKIDSHKQQDFVDNKEQIKDYISQELASRYFYEAGRVEARLKNDKEIDAALELLQHKKEYYHLLNLKQ